VGNRGSGKDRKGLLVLACSQRHPNLEGTPVAIEDVLAKLRTCRCWAEGNCSQLDVLEPTALSRRQDPVRASPRLPPRNSNGLQCRGKHGPNPAYTPPFRAVR